MKARTLYWRLGHTSNPALIPSKCRGENKQAVDKLINAAIQMLGQLAVFKEILLKKYKHKEAVELFAAFDAAEKNRPF